MRILSGKKAELLVRKLEQRGETDLARVERSVQKIVRDVRNLRPRTLRCRCSCIEPIAVLTTLPI